MSKFDSLAIFNIKSKISSLKNISSLSNGNIYSPLEINAPILLEYNEPIFFLFLTILIRESFSFKYSNISEELSFEKSFIKIISKSVKIWFCIELIAALIVFSQLYTGIIALIIGLTTLL